MCPQCLFFCTEYIDLIYDKRKNGLLAVIGAPPYAGMGRGGKCGA